MRQLCLVVCLSWSLAVAAAEPLPTTSDAVGWALADIVTVPEADRPFMRYVWIPPWGSDRWVAATNYAVNAAASHAAVVMNGTTIANGWMVRFDLRRYAPKPEQLTKLIAVWDSLAVQDPYFHVPDTNSKTSAAILSPHLQAEQAAALSGLSFSTGGLYRADFFIVRALSTLERGKYYEFRQIQFELPKDTPGTPQSHWLSSFGVFELQTQLLNGDQRAAMPFSKITGKPRRVDAFYGLGRGGNLVSLTHDLTDDDVAAETNPIRNLLEFKDKAREIIVEMPNGLHAFALTDASGKFVRGAPDDVARDNTIPAPFTSRLQPAISCIRCHGPDDGWKPMSNDVQKLLSILDVISDISSFKIDGKPATREQIIDRLVSLYAGQLDGPDAPLGRGRRDYNKAMALILQGLPLQDGETPVISVSSTVAEIYSSYRYTLVTPEIAARELGGETLDAALGQPADNPIVDPIEGLLRANVPITRSDWEVIYGDLAAKAAQRRKK